MKVNKEKIFLNTFFKIIYFQRYKAYCLILIFNGSEAEKPASNQYRNSTKQSAIDK